MARPDHGVPGGLLGQLEWEIKRRNAACYWPGPWTLDNTRAGQLIGREEDIGELVYLIRDRSLIVLSGDSGVGKSSLLAAGLIPALQADGYKTLVCNDWTDGRSGPERSRGLEGVSSFLTQKFDSDLERLGIVVPEPDDLVTFLDDTYGSEVVLILDQFEEVIRQQPKLFRDLCDWIEKVADSSQVHVLVSLRSEYAHHLADLRFNAYRREDQTIPAIRDIEKVRAIILSGRAPAGAPAGADSALITPDAVELIIDEWTRAGAHELRSRIRLLHLQALLYSLWTRQPAGGTITAHSVQEFLDDARASARRHLEQAAASGAQPISPEDLAISVFDWALANVVGVHVDLCGEIFDAIRAGDFVDLPLKEGVLHALVRLAEHLSSGGYKVDQEEVHLATLVLADELRTLGYNDDSDNDVDPEAEALRIIQAFAELTRATDFDWVAAPTRELVARLDAVDEGVAGARFHKRGVAAGALLGATPKQALIEEARRFFVALAWLRAGSLIRSSPSDDGRSFVALSHDGFGRGLNEWADQNDARPETALYAVTAAFGRAYGWPAARVQDPELNPLFRPDDGHPRLFVNLLWRACRIVGTPKRNIHIRNVVFMNCDLRGTTFQHCTLQGVVFINCLMDGVQFEDCRIVGRATPLELLEPAKTKDRELPSFLWPDQDDVAATLNHYRVARPASAQWLHSATSGESVGVVELVESAGGADRAPYQVTEAQITARAEKQNGGLALFGGRLSSLAFYRCDFDQQAEVSLRHVAGTSLDFFEHEGGRVELYDVALRGVTISPPITASLEGAAPVHVEFEAVDSHLENVWFSSGLEGTAEIKNSIIWQLFNGSQRPTGGFAVTLDEDSPHLGIENVPAEAVKGIPMEAFDPVDAADWYRNSIRQYVSRIDYRSPAENRLYRERSGDVIEVIDEDAER